MERASPMTAEERKYIMSELLSITLPVQSKKAAYMKFHQECCEKMMEITKKKNEDYTGTIDDPFANFSRTEALGICTTEQGFLTRMTDKLCRINSYLQRGELLVKDESVTDTLLDLANYSILMAGYLKQKVEQS